MIPPRTVSSQGRAESLAALLLCAGIALGAFGAHALRGVLPAEQLAIYEKAIFYQIISALGALTLSALSSRASARLMSIARALILGGSCIFSGSLYCYVLSGLRGFAMVTPVGGIALILGWLCAAAALGKNQASGEIDPHL